MPGQAKIYIYGVTAAGAAVLGASLVHWSMPYSSSLLIYLLLASLASLVKLRLPGMGGMYSLNFLFLLFGIVHLNLPETVIAGCLGALVQSVFNAKKRPMLIQVLFNMANLTLSVALCFLVIRRIAPADLNQYRPAQMALVAFLYFVANTVLVSGVLAFLQGKRLAEICREWYIWYLPYYLIGAAGVGLLPLRGQPFNPEAWLVLLPLVYLVHFFLGLLDLRPRGEAATVRACDTLPRAARLYLAVVLLAGVILIVAAISQWQSQDPLRFATYLVLTAVGAALKIRLPGMRGTLSGGFVIVLVAIAELSLAETVAIGIAVGLIQCLWRPKRRPLAVQVFFNASAFGLSAAAAYLVSHWAHPWIGHSIATLLAIATVVQYTCNTVMVAGVLCLVEEKPLSKLWQNCHFWTCPYYLVGAAAAGLMTAANQTAGWITSLAVLPLMLLVYVSYRIHLARAESVLWGS
jgi:hypothetical protein